MVYKTPEDKERGGIDFGICLVGDVFEQKFALTNEGEFPGELALAHPNERITLEVPGMDVGAISLKPNCTIDISVIFKPDRRERITEPVVIPIEENPTLLVPVSGFSGFCSYDLSGTVDFVNMMLEEINVMVLKLTNTGDIRFPFEVFLDPPELSEIFTINVKHKGAFLEPETEPVDIEITGQPHKVGNVVGKVVFKTNLGRGPVVREYPISFYAYKDPIIISNSETRDWGRLSVGDSESEERFLTNFAPKKYFYRIRTIVLQYEPDRSEYDVASEGTQSARATPATPKEAKPRTASAKRPKTPKSAVHPEAWQVVPSEGVIAPGENPVIKFGFTALEVLGDEWLEARFILERSLVRNDLSSS